MEFKKVFRGYDPKEVDKYIADTAEREGATRRAQRERINELSEENYNLRERIVELQRRQNDVAEAMLVAQKIASEMEQNAKENADRALFEAKKFYATWQAYAKTIVASFTEEELFAFNTLERKIGDVIANYERKQKGDEVAAADVKSGKTAAAKAVAKDAANEQGEPTAANAEVAASAEAKTAAKAAPKASKPKRKSAEDFVKLMEQAADELNNKSKRAEEKSKSSKKSVNPIDRVEQAAGQSVDLKDLLRPEQSLEELCSDLGLINTDDSDDSEDE